MPTRKRSNDVASAAVTLAPLPEPFGDEVGGFQLPMRKLLARDGGTATPLKSTGPEHLTPRPDGRNPTDYAGCEEWTRLRWAWEFLIRNEAFRRACDGTVDGASRKETSELCETFGLKRFKHYRTGYRVGGFPRFAASSVTSWSRVDEEKFARLKLPTKLNPGEVLIRFDLNPALSNARSIRAQVSRAKNRLDARLTEYLSSKGKQRQYEKPKSDHFLVALRMSDAKAAKMKNAAIARMLFPTVVRGKSDDEAASYFKSRYRSARDLIEGGYMAVAASQDAQY